MASRSFHDLLLRARDDLARTSHRGHALVVALLALHLTVITPFADADRRQAALERERQRLEEVGPAIEELAQRLDGIAGPPVQAMSPALGRLVEGVRGDLERLEATRWRLRGATDENGVEPALAMRPPSPGTAPLPLADDELVSLGQADNRYSLLTVLEPIIGRLVIEPRFAEVQRRWQETVLPALGSEIDTLIGALPRLRERFGEANSEWAALERSLGDLRRTAAELRFEPPGRPYWWASAETAQVFELGVDATTAEVLQRPLALDRLASAAAEVRDRAASLRSFLLVRVERAHGADTELGRALAALGIDLAGATPFFPLALGILLAVVLMRRGQRLRQLAVSVRLAVDHGAPDALRLWCLSEVAASGRSDLGVTAAERRAQGRILGGLVLVWCWLALAGWQLHGPPGDRSPEWLPTLLGAAAVLLAAVQRLLSAQGACQLMLAEGPGDDYFFHGPVDDYGVSRADSGGPGGLLEPAAAGPTNAEGGVAEGARHEPGSPAGSSPTEPVATRVDEWDPRQGPPSELEDSDGLAESVALAEPVVPEGPGHVEGRFPPDEGPVYDEPARADGRPEPGGTVRLAEPGDRPSSQRAGTGEWADASDGMAVDGRPSARPGIDEGTITVADDEGVDPYLDGHEPEEFDSTLRR